MAKSWRRPLFEVVSRAYERTGLMVTTNLPFEEWPEVLGSERLTGALLDRLTHRVHILEANGESYRLRDAKNNASKDANPKTNERRAPSFVGLLRDPLPFLKDPNK